MWENNFRTQSLIQLKRKIIFSCWWISFCVASGKNLSSLCCCCRHKTYLRRRRCITSRRRIRKEKPETPVHNLFTFLSTRLAPSLWERKSWRRCLAWKKISKCEKSHNFLLKKKKKSFLAGFGSSREKNRFLRSL